MPLDRPLVENAGVRDFQGVARPLVCQGTAVLQAVGVGEGPAEELLVSPAMSFGQPRPHKGGLKAKHPVRIGPLETRGAPPMQANSPLIEGPRGFSCTNHLQPLIVQAAKCSVFEGTLEDWERWSMD